MSVQQLVIDWARENFFVVKEMQLLSVRQRDLAMFFQKIVQRGRARFLRAGDNEIEPLHLSTFSEDRHRAGLVARVNREDCERRSLVCSTRACKSWSSKHPCDREVLARCEYRSREIGRAS